MKNYIDFYKYIGDRYDDVDYQEVYFVVDSFADMKHRLKYRSVQHHNSILTCRDENSTYFRKRVCAFHRAQALRAEASERAAFCIRPDHSVCASDRESRHC